MNMLLLSLLWREKVVMEVLFLVCFQIYRDQLHHDANKTFLVHYDTGSASESASTAQKNPVEYQ